jgi:hypothetical protein
MNSRRVPAFAGDDELWWVGKAIGVRDVLAA